MEKVLVLSLGFLVNMSLFSSPEDKSYNPSFGTVIVNKTVMVLDKVMLAVFYSIDLLRVDSPYATQKSNPFTYNLNPVGQYLNAYINSVVPSPKYALVPGSELAIQREEAQQHCQTVIQNIPEHFVQLFDPTTGILN